MLLSGGAVRERRQKGPLTRTGNAEHKYHDRRRKEEPQELSYPPDNSPLPLGSYEWGPGENVRRGTAPVTKKVYEEWSPGETAAKLAKKPYQPSFFEQSLETLRTIEKALNSDSAETELKNLRNFSQGLKDSEDKLTALQLNRLSQLLANLIREARFLAGRTQILSNEEPDTVRGISTSKTIRDLGVSVRSSNLELDHEVTRRANYGLATLHRKDKQKIAALARTHGHSAAAAEEQRLLALREAQLESDRDPLRHNLPIQEAAIEAQAIQDADHLVTMKRIAKLKASIVKFNEVVDSLKDAGLDNAAQKQELEAIHAYLSGLSAELEWKQKPEITTLDNLKINSTQATVARPRTPVKEPESGDSKAMTREEVAAAVEALKNKAPDVKPKVWESLVATLRKKATAAPDLVEKLRTDEKILHNIWLADQRRLNDVAKFVELAPQLTNPDKQKDFKTSFLEVGSRRLKSELKPIFEQFNGFRLRLTKEAHQLILGIRERFHSIATKTDSPWSNSPLIQDAGQFLERIHSKAEQLNLLPTQEGFLVRNK